MIYIYIFFLRTISTFYYNNNGDVAKISFCVDDNYVLKKDPLSITKIDLHNNNNNRFISRKNTTDDTTKNLIFFIPIK